MLSLRCVWLTSNSPSPNCLAVISCSVWGSIPLQILLVSSKSLFYFILFFLNCWPVFQFCFSWVLLSVLCLGSSSPQLVHTSFYFWPCHDQVLSIFSLFIPLCDTGAGTLQSTFFLCLLLPVQSLEEMLGRQLWAKLQGEKECSHSCFS